MLSQPAAAPLVEPKLEAVWQEAEELGMEVLEVVEVASRADVSPNWTEASPDPSASRQSEDPCPAFPQREHLCMPFGHELLV